MLTIHLRETGPTKAAEHRVMEFFRERLALDSAAARPRSPPFPPRRVRSVRPARRGFYAMKRPIPAGRGSAPAGPTQRQLRAGELVRHALVEILREQDINDPALAGVSVTLTEVRMSPDLQHATCFVEPLGGGAGAPRWSRR